MTKVTRLMMTKCIHQNIPNYIASSIICLKFKVKRCLFSGYVSYFALNNSINFYFSLPLVSEKFAHLTRKSVYAVRQVLFDSFLLMILFTRNQIKRLGNDIFTSKAIISVI